MPSFLLSGLTRFVPWILAGLLVIGGVIYVRHLQDALAGARGNVAAAEATIGQLTAVNAQNLASLKRLQAQDAAWQAAVASTMNTDSHDTRLTDMLVSAANAAAAKDDAPVAPVLVSTLAAIAKAQGSSLRRTAP